MNSPAYALGVLGAGKMGSALVRGLVRRQALDASQIIVTDVQPAALEALAEACPGVTVTAEVAQVAAHAEALLVAVKPQDAEAALVPLTRPAGQLVISIMAGVPIARLTEMLGAGCAIVRAMPNVVCEVLEGAFGYATNEHVTGSQAAQVAAWFGALGVAERLPEKLLDAVTGLSGSGPAFVALFIEALADGGVAAGLPRPVAQRLAAQTVLGSARWVLDKAGPAALKDAVCSPAGTTIAGVRQLEAAGLRSGVIEAVVAATARSRELAG
jgi:pyrroline-5-carboxylate reductase